LHTVIDGLHIQYEVQGEGRPVLLLHGWGANIAAMKPVADCVAAMGRKAVSLDFPGFGKSDPPTEPWSVKDYAALTKSFIEQQGLRGADVICHSFGGRVCIVLASEDKDLFGRMVFVDAAGVRPKRGLKYYFKVGRYKLGKRLKNISWIDRLFHLQERQKNAGSEDYRALSGVMRATFVKVVNEDLTPRLENIQNSTLLIWGSEDKDTPLYMAEKMEKSIPDAGLVKLEGAGHFSYLDQYPAFCAVLRSFLAN